LGGLSFGLLLRFDRRGQGELTRVAAGSSALAAAVSSSGLGASLAGLLAVRGRFFLERFRVTSAMRRASSWAAW
jgi:hypothetical protein